MRLLVFFLVIPLMAQFPKIPGVGKRPAAQQNKVEFNREFYENLKNFAEGFYKQKERLDFRQKSTSITRRSCAKAFDVNTSPVTGPFAPVTPTMLHVKLGEPMQQNAKENCYEAKKQSGPAKQQKS